MKIAFLSTYPFKTGRTDKEHIYKDIVDVIKKDVEIEFFSLSDKNSTTKFSGLVQHEIKGLAPRNKFVAHVAILDYMSLLAFGQKYSPKAIRDNKALFDSLKEYNPDFVITSDPAFYEFIKRFIKNTDSKFIFMTDAWSRERYNIVWWDELRTKNLQFLYPISRKRYVDYTFGVFDGLLSLSSAVILSSAYHKEQFEKLFPKYSKKAYWAPHHVVRKEPRRRIKRSIRNILYIGVNDPQAMQMIEDIAKDLPGKTVTMAGYGVPKAVVGNVRFFGSFKESEKNLLFGQADVCIAPIPAGTGGRRAKLFDYFLYGKAVIGTKFAFEGYDGITEGKNALIEDDIGKFAQKILWLEKHPKTFIEMQKNSRAVLKDVTKEEARVLWRRLLNQLASK